MIANKIGFGLLMTAFLLQTLRSEAQESAEPLKKVSKFKLDKKGAQRRKWHISRNKASFECPGYETQNVAFRQSPFASRFNGSQKQPNKNSNGRSHNQRIDETQTTPQSLDAIRFP